MSFDVISLFANVPPKKTIEIVLNYLYADTANVMPVGKKNLYIDDVFSNSRNFYV